MKEKYLEELKERLLEYNISEDELIDILDDYGEMIDDALGKEMTEEYIIKMIGTPKQVVKDLSAELEKGKEYIYIHKGGAIKNKHRNKITALMPFISLVVFFVLGFGFELWHPGWLVFLSIPIVAIIVNAFDKTTMTGLVALSPFIALIVYLIMGFGYNLWHPGWLVFLMIPILGVFSGYKQKRMISLLVSISPFLCIIAVVLIGTYTGMWNPYWLLFMIIPMLGMLHEKKIWKVILMELSFVIAITAYLVVGYTTGEWLLGGLAFLIPIGLSLLLSEDTFLVINKENKDIWILTALLIIVYVGFGVLIPYTWGFLWMLFLSIPIYAIIKHSPREHNLIACMPFISVIIFFSLGFFFGWWAFSWMAFLLIPVVAIIKNA